MDWTQTIPIIISIFYVGFFLKLMIFNLHSDVRAQSSRIDQLYSKLNDLLKELE